MSHGAPPPTRRAIATLIVLLVVGVGAGTACSPTGPLGGSATSSGDGAASSSTATTPLIATTTVLPTGDASSTTRESPTTSGQATASRPPEGDRVANLVAFARLVNYVRFFHPSDEAAAADWGRFVVGTSQSVMEVDGPEELAAQLGQAFYGIAPTLSVFPSSEPPGRETPGLASCGGGQLVAWEHRGVATGEVIDATGFVSRRVFVGTHRSEWPEWFPNPAAPLRVQLGGGVSALIPLALCVADGTTVPPSTGADWSAAGPPEQTYGLYRAEDRTTRVAAVILAWGFFQHFYPYWDVVTSDWDEALGDALTQALDQPGMPLIELLRRLVAKTNDGHAVVFEQEAWQASASLPLAWEWIESQIVITDVGPSAAELVTPGDAVATIDGVPAADVVDEAVALVAGATPERRIRVALEDLAWGPHGSSVDLEVISAKGVRASVTLLRESWEPPTATRPAPIDLLPGGVAYLDLTRVGPSDIGSDLERIEGVDRLIADLRGYPTSAAWDLFFRLLEEPVSTDRFLIPVTTRPDGAGRFFEDGSWQATPESPRLADRVVFLTDERAISAAETLLGIVKAHQVGAIVGSATAGTNGDVIGFVVPGGFRIWMTALRVVKLDGSDHHGIGVLPDVEVARTIAGVRSGADEVLDAALGLLSG